MTRDAGAEMQETPRPHVGQPGAIAQWSPHLAAAAQPLYLSFIGGPDPRYTPQLLALLERHQAKATFFVSGRRAARFDYLIRRLLREGHALGHCGYSGRPALAQIPGQARADVRLGVEVLRNLTGRAPMLYCPPARLGSRAMQAEARALGAAVLSGARRLPRPGPQAEPQALLRALHAAAPGDILLASDAGGLWHQPQGLLDALPRFLTSLRFHGGEAAVLQPQMLAAPHAAAPSGVRAAC